MPEPPRRTALARSTAGGPFLPSSPGSILPSVEARIEPARFIQLVEVLLVVSGAIMIGQAVLALA